MQYIINNRLITEEEWKSSIRTIRNDFNDDLIDNKEKAIEIIKEPLINAIRERTTKKFGILLSGGLDSSLIALICKKLKQININNPNHALYYIKGNKFSTSELFKTIFGNNRAVIRHLYKP